MKVLVTAFKPFNKEQINHSEEVLKYIQNVQKTVLEVCYDACYEELKNKFNLDKFDLIVALGEARSRSNLMIEECAYNLSKCSISDNSGVLYTDKIIVEGGKNVLMTQVKLPPEIDKSSDPGRFVCNNLYYHLLYNYQNKSIFIHVPNCSNDDYFKYANVINEIINYIIHQ